MGVLHTYEHKGLVLTVTADAEAPAPPRNARSRAPGSGRFEIGEISLTVWGADVTLLARIAGSNIAFVYGEVLLKDPNAERFYGPITREHVHAEHDRESLGGIRPEWGAEFEANITLSLSLSVLTDAREAAFCFTTPEGYGDSDRRVEGLYDIVGSTTPMRARLLIDRAGNLSRIVGYRAQGRRSLPRPLQPKEGDRFTPFVEVLEPSAKDGGWRVSRALAVPLTFRMHGLSVVTQPPLPGEYLAGVLVEDLDGRMTRKYASFAL